MLSSFMALCEGNPLVTSGLPHKWPVMQGSDVFFVVTSHLTHWGRVTHICVSRLTIIGSDNGLSPDRRQAIIWTNAGLLLIGPLGTNFSEILIAIHTFSFKKIHLKMSSRKCRPFCLGLNVLRYHGAHVISLLCTRSDNTYRKVSNIRPTKSQNLNASRLILWLSLPNLLKPGVKLRMKM